MIRDAELEISIPNLKHNFNYFKSKLNSNTKLLIIVKANAYGHDSVLFSKLMEEMGADYLAVATVKEGLVIKSSGVKLPILVLSGGSESYSEIIENDMEPSIPSLEYLIKLVSVMKQKGVSSYPIHIKLDTGMHRLGFRTDEIPELVNFLKVHPEVVVKSLYSHLATADTPEYDEFTLAQISLYDSMCKEIEQSLPYKPIRHCLNSAGIERFPQYQFDMVRLGIGIYGVSILDHSLLRPASSFRCPILQVRTLSREDGTVGYGKCGVLKNEVNQIATIPVGYADGVNRRLGRGNISFEVNGHLVPTIGNICMDMCMLDITGVDAKPGDIVTIFGDNPTVNDIARVLETIPYEVYTSIPARVRKVITL